MARTYTVVTGDTLSGIAVRYGTTVAVLLALNPAFVDDPNLIHPGDVVVIPVGSSVFDVKDFGAVGDGVTDDSAAIQAALDAAAVSGGEVVYPLSTYSIATPLQILSTPIIMSGVGAPSTSGSSSVIKAAGSMNHMLELAAHNSRISQLLFDGNGLAERGVLFSDAGRSRIIDVHVMDCTVSGFEWDIDAIDPQGNNNTMKLDSCIATRCDVGFRVPTRQGDNNNITLRDCISQLNTSHGASIKGNGWLIERGNYFANGGAGIQIGEPDDTIYSTGNLIFWVWIESNAADGVLFDKAVRCALIPIPGVQDVDYQNSATPKNVQMLFNTGGTGQIEIKGNESGKKLILRPGGIQVVG